MKLPSEIFNEVCQTMGIAFYYGERWKQSFDSVKATYPAIFMDSVIHNPEGLIQSQYNNIEFSFIICTSVAVKNYASIDFATFTAVRKQMIEKGYEFLVNVSQYTDGNVLIAGGEPTIKVIEDIPFGLFDNYVEGVMFNVNWKIIDLKSVC